jgi:hypothetical protein
MAIRLDRFPVDGTIWFSDRSYYERRGPKKLLHRATDIFGRRGEATVLAVPLTITAVAVSPNGGNNVTGVDEAGNSYYHAHLDTLAIGTAAVGRSFPAGFKIGTVGNSGNARTTRCHTHFQVKDRRGRGVDMAGALNDVLRREGRRKGKSECQKVQVKCPWCRDERAEVP